MTARDVRWFVPQLQLRPLGPRRGHVRNPMNGAALKLSSGEYAVLSSCEGCETLPAHEERAAERLLAPPEHRAAIHELLEGCVRSGLLMALPDLVARFGAPAAAGPQALAAVVVRTADRPQLLARLLASAAALEARFGSRRRWIVIDDSRDPVNERANRAALEAHRALDVEHVDRAAAAVLEQTLRLEFPRLASEIAWVLGAGSPLEATYGVPVNHALLRLAGRTFVTVDDDVIIDARRPAISEPGFSVSDEADALRWYESEEALWRDCPALELDPVTAHEQWLGLAMAEAWAQAEAQAGAPVEIRVSAVDVARFAAGARVLFTHNHACGDPGSSLLPLQLLALPRRSRQWLASDPQAAAYGFTSRIDWRGQARLRLAPGRILTFTTMTGIDNTRLLPPTARSHRSEDVLLGIVAQHMYPSSWVVDLPFGLPHLRAPAKRWLGSRDAFAQEPLHVVYSQVDEHAPQIVSASAEQRIAAIGALLLDLAAASDRRLGETLLQHATDAGSRTLFSIQEQLDDTTLPAQWKAALEPWLQSPALTADEARARVLSPTAVRPLLEAYGRALIAWPLLWEFCQERNR